jgi:hypothetical protein
VLFGSHRVPKQNRSGKCQFPDELNDVGRVVSVSVPLMRSARIPVPPGIRHHHIVFVLETVSQRSPAGSVSSQPVKQNQRGLDPSGSQIMDAVCFTDAANPTRH